MDLQLENRRATSRADLVASASNSPGFSSKRPRALRSLHAAQAQRDSTAAEFGDRVFPIQCDRGPMDLTADTRPSGPSSTSTGIAWKRELTPSSRACWRSSSLAARICPQHLTDHGRGDSRAPGSAAGMRSIVLNAGMTASQAIFFTIVIASLSYNLGPALERTPAKPACPGNSRIESHPCRRVPRSSRRCLHTTTSHT